MNKLLQLHLIWIWLLIGISAVTAAEKEIKPGHIISITVLGSPELSKSALVYQDGTTDYPLLAGIPVDGLTAKQLQEILQPIVARFVERPRIFINLTDYTQFEVTVEGQVQKPGNYIVKGPINLQGVLSIAGGVMTQADLRQVRISRKGYDSGEEIVFDLYAFFLDQENIKLPELQNGDIVFVPMIRPSSLIRVMGSVRFPGTYSPEKGNTIIDMIYLAGGPSELGNLKRVIHISNVDGKLQSNIIDLKTLTNRGLIAQIPLANSSDVIVVTEYPWWQNTSWWGQTIRDVALITTSLIVLSGL